PWLYLQNNNFTFEDIEPNIYFDTLYYIPQDSVLDTDTLTAVVDSPFVISSKIGGTANHYQWYKNGDSITGATDSVLYFPAVAWSDSGFYTCRITNDIVTDLTLWRHTVTLWVTDTLTGVRPKTQDSNFKSQISILPNPVLRGETVFVELPEEYYCRELRIYGVAGGQVMAIPLQRNRTVIKFSSAGLEHGVYFVKVVVGDGRSYVEKFVVY
ncbi:MAG: T9SS type A sorting domain-containing protein, partial [Bacteroidia bacterium]|nr:T9SS type A sorting domain-containing protein [Bacteroidia bacterium]